jgi:hypothetical protein
MPEFTIKHEFLAPDFDVFVQDMFGRSDRAGAILGGALVDDSLATLLESHLIEITPADRQLLFGERGPFGTFSSKTLTAFALGLIGKRERRDLDLIRRIRNDFHNTKPISFQTPAIKSRCAAIEVVGIASENSDPKYRYCGAAFAYAGILRGLCANSEDRPKAPDLAAFTLTFTRDQPLR